MGVGRSACLPKAGTEDSTRAPNYATQCCLMMSASKCLCVHSLACTSRVNRTHTHTHTYRAAAACTVASTGGQAPAAWA
eukprot:scaffold297649_cov21-Tisochrysis_lutea.AAC.2